MVSIISIYTSLQIVCALVTLPAGSAQAGTTQSSMYVTASLDTKGYVYLFGMDYH